VWVIDTIATDVLMDVSAAAEETAAFWARKMAESVVRVIARGEDGDRVMRFATRAEYLAYFLRDLGAGSAWGKWHYRQFESLRSLPSGVAIREALLREPEQAEPALLHLARTGGIATVSRLLSQLDQERLLQLLSPQEASPDKKCFDVALQQWAAAPTNTPHALELYLKVRLSMPEAPAAEARAAAQHVLCLARWEQRSQLKEIVTAVAIGSVSRLLRSVLRPEQNTALYLGFLVNQDPELALRLAAIGRARHPQAWAGSATQQAKTESSSGLVSPWAGVFLLLPALMADPELMTAFGKAGDSVSRYLLLGATIRVCFAESQYDPALNAAAGLEFPPELAALAAHFAQARPTIDQAAFRQNLLPQDLEQVDRASSHCWPDIALDQSPRRDLALTAALLLRNFARQLPGLGKSSFDYLWKTILSGSGVIRTTPGQMVVELAPRPLDIVLRMAGFDHVRFTPPWMTSITTAEETEVIVRFGSH
jgi:hypothetical protein